MKGGVCKMKKYRTPKIDLDSKALEKIKQTEPKLTVEEFRKRIGDDKKKRHKYY